jgi:hypothetical protein
MIYVIIPLRFVQTPATYSAVAAAAEVAAVVDYTIHH